jgi:lipopolysaccharide/colanic/teichoic acid biosynthesis glycosyltransferase
MNHLAVSNNQSLKLTQFNMASFFLTDSFLFHRINANEVTFYTLETLLAIFLVILFSPIMILSAIAIKLSTGGSIFYQQTRVGKNGKLFKITKFRTMIENAEAKTGPVLSSLGDNRVTTLGKFLRSSHFDELPQLFNVLKSEMSLIGPRPERPEFVEIFKKEFDEYEKRSIVKPGITGLAQICLGYDASPVEKLEYDLFYIEHKESIIFHIMISYYTAIKMLTFYKNN